MQRQRYEHDYRHQREIARDLIWKDSEPTEHEEHGKEHDQRQKPSTVSPQPLVVLRSGSTALEPFASTIPSDVRDEDSAETEHDGECDIPVQWDGQHVTGGYRASAFIAFA